MGLTNPDQTLRRSSLLSISLKLMTLFGIPPFFINSFWLAFFFALLVGLNLSFLTAALVRFIKIAKVVFSSSSRRSARIRSCRVLLPLLINNLPASLPSSVSCSIYANGLAIRSSSRSVPAAKEATEGALFQLERWSEYRCLFLNASKREVSLFSVDPHQANLQPNLLLFNSPIHLNPTPTSLGITFDHTLSFSKHVYSLKAKFFPRLKALRCISASLWGSFKEFLSLLYKSFLRTPSHLCFTQMFTFHKRYQYHQIGTPSPSG